MKTRESGMPPEEMWQGFFDPSTVLRKLGLTETCGTVVDFGCGYGTFAIPAAAIVRDTVYAVDIDPAMVAITQSKAAERRLSNMQTIQRDVIESGSGLPDASADYVMLFNLLHAEEAPLLLAEARRILHHDGRLAVMHWNYDVNTPRGPSMAIRLQPQECVRLVESAGFIAGDCVELPPYHYGFVANLSTS